LFSATELVDEMGGSVSRLPLVAVRRNPRWIDSNPVLSL